MIHRVLLRKLRLAPGYSFTVICLVGVTVAACAILARVTSSTLLIPTTSEGPERLVRIYTSDVSRQSEAVGRYGRSSFTDFVDVSAALDGKASVAASASHHVLVDIADREFTAKAEFVSQSYFDILRPVPVVGRTTNSSELGLIVSYDFWVEYLGQPTDLSRSSVRVQGVALPVRAVLPASFVGMDYAEKTDLWMPLESFKLLVTDETPPDLYRDNRRVGIVGRLQTSTTLAQTQAALNLAAMELQRTFPATNARQAFVVLAAPYLIGEAERALLGLNELLERGALVLAALLILVYANLANLFAARALLAQRETAIRKALGATNLDLVASTVAEAAALIVPGVLLGSLLAQGVFTWGLANHPLFGRSSAGPWTLWTILAILCAGVLATVALGSVPAFWAQRQHPSAPMKSNDGDLPLRNARILWAMVAIQLCVAVYCGGLASGGLRRLWKLEKVAPGFDIDQVVDVGIRLRVSGMGAQVYHEVEALLQRVAAIPGVESVATAEVSLLGGLPLRQTIGVVGREFGSTDAPNVRFDVVSQEYFAVLGLPVLLGGFSANGHLQPAFAEVVVNEEFAERYLRRGQELDETVLLRERHPVRVAGVVADAVTDGLEENEEPRMYLLHRRDAALGQFRLLVRTTGPAAQHVPNLARWMQKDTKVLAMSDLEALSDRRARVIAPARNATQMLAGVSLSVVMLVGIGVYGILTLSIESVRRSLAIRIALGAPAGQIVVGVLRPMLIAFVCAAFLAISTAVVLTLLSWGPEVNVLDVAVALPLVALALAASCVPILRRLLRSSPAEVLKS